MLEGFEALGISAVDLTASALLGITVLSILRGLIVPRAVVEARVAAAEARVTDAKESEEEWKRAAAAATARAVAAEAQNLHLLQYSATSAHALSEIQRAAAHQSGIAYIPAPILEASPTAPPSEQS